MPGDNCSIYGCSASRRHTGLTFFKVPKEKDDATKKWASNLINIITKYRVVDPPLKKKIDHIEHKKLWICERNFSARQMWIYSDRKKLKDGELPSLNLPVKSALLTSPTTSRSTSSIDKREQSQ